MTNREKIIADIANWLKGLDTSQLAQVVDDIFYENFGCKHCAFNEADGHCTAPFNDCVEGIKEWLQRDDKSIAEKAQQKEGRCND